MGIFGILGFTIGFASEPPPADEAAGSVSVRLYQVEGSLPADDPNSAQWASVPESEFKLAPQVHWKDRIQEVTVKSVKVKGLHDGQTSQFWLNMKIPPRTLKMPPPWNLWWATKRLTLLMGSQCFRLKEARSIFGFGKKKMVKALDMSAKGFKTLTTQEKQDVKAAGVWEGGSWKVVFSRALKTEDEQDVQIEPGEWRSIAFAFWDGAVVDGLVKEKGSQKAVSSWWSIRAEPSADNSIYRMGDFWSCSGCRV